MNEQGQSTFSDDFCFKAGTPETQANERMVEWLATGNDTKFELSKADLGGFDSSLSRRHFLGFAIIQQDQHYMH
jgi:hypothetical protein